MIHARVYAQAFTIGVLLSTLYLNMKEVELNNKLPQLPQSWEKYYRIKVNYRLGKTLYINWFYNKYVISIGSIEVRCLLLISTPRCQERTTANVRNCKKAN